MQAHSKKEIPQEAELVLIVIYPPSLLLSHRCLECCQYLLHFRMSGGKTRSALRRPSAPFAYIRILDLSTEQGSGLPVIVWYTIHLFKHLGTSAFKFIRVVFALYRDVNVSEKGCKSREQAMLLLLLTASTHPTYVRTLKGPSMNRNELSG